MTTNTLEKYETTTQQIYRGEIWIAMLPDTGGSVQNGNSRPFLILQNDVGNRYSPTVFGIPLTSKVKKNMITHTKLLAADVGLIEDSIVLGEQIITIPTSNLKNKVCKLSENELVNVELAHLISAGFTKRYDIKLKEAK